LETRLKAIKHLIVICIIFSSTYKLSAVLCVSIGNGDWNTPANWSCGAVPGCGDSIVIKAGTTVSITTQQDYTGCGTGPVISIYGTLYFQTGNKLRLPCDSRIYIFPGGSIQPGGGGGNSNFIEICSDIVWNAAAGTLTGPSCLPTSLPACGAVLPVELINFSGEAKDGYVDLKWATVTEHNNSHFEIERSVDASLFKKISAVNSKSPSGNSNGLLHYSEMDNAPEDNISYYRLRQVDKDNSFAYSGIISVNYIKAKNVKFTVYPNPNKGEFTADISGIENNHEIQISLKDQNGRLVYNSTFFIQDEASKKLNIVPESKLPNGLYICTLTLEGIDYNVKVIVS